MRVGGIKLKAILRRFTFFIKEIQNRKTLLCHSFADIKPYLVLLQHIIPSYLFIVLTKTTNDEQDYLQFGVQQEKEP